MRKSAGLVAIALLVALVGGVGVVDTPTGVDTEPQVDERSDVVQECVAPQPEDFADPQGDTGDVVGWVDGYWYNEPLDIEAEGELTDAELEALAARTAARVEAIRCLTFEELPPIEMVTREDFETRYADEEPSPELAAFREARLRTTLLVSLEDDPLAVYQDHYTGFPSNYYHPSEEYIGFVTEDPDTVTVDEVSLAHELVHTLQGQHFSDDQYIRTTNDHSAAVQALTEGDAKLVDYRYEQACDAAVWVEECVRPPDDESTSPTNWGLFVNDYYPYSAGYVFVKHLYQTGGWQAVNDAYDNLPETTLETTYPENYGDAERESISIEDKSSDEWDRLSADSVYDHEVIGQHGLVAMLVAPAYESADTPIIELDDFLRDHPRHQVSYDHPEVRGWQGDRFYAYTDGQRVGAVWEIAWSDSDDAEQFAEAYEHLITYRGGERVAEQERVYEFDGEFAIAIAQEEDRLVIVSAPTVEDLSAIQS